MWGDPFFLPPAVSAPNGFFPQRFFPQCTPGPRRPLPNRHAPSVTRPLSPSPVDLSPLDLSRLDCERPIKLRARLIAPVASPPGAGFVELHRGRISALSATPDSTALDLGNVALLPGLVNAHTHLELSDCAQPLDTRRHFTEWVGELLAHRQARPPVWPPGHSPVARGAREIRDTGSTQAGDIVAADWSPDQLPPTGPGGVAFLELLGFGADRRATLLRLAQDHLDRHPSRPPPGTATNAESRAPGTTPADPTSSSATSPATNPRVPSDWLTALSPHAPYSVHRDLLRAVIDLAIAADAPVAMHVAETPEERQLLTHQSGPFVSFLDRLGVPWRGGLMESCQEVLQELARAPRALIIHGNDLTPDEIVWLATQPHMTVVYCPRTHAGFGHSPHPWARLLEQRVPIALGTDSRASNPNLSLWEELQFLARRHPELPPTTLLEWGTRNGARALWGTVSDRTSRSMGHPAVASAEVRAGGGPQTDPDPRPLGPARGELEPGARAELTLVRLAPGLSDPLAQLFAPGCWPIATLRGTDWQPCSHPV